MLPTSVYAQVQRTNPSRIYSSTHRRGRCYAQLNYYEVLGVEVDASEQDIKAAFRRQAKVVHPDVNPAADAAETFRTLKRAHEVLSNRMLRQEHDTKLALPSAQAKDPRFARFYRWRREVIPDLEIALDEWTEQVNGIVKSADKELWDMERQCLQLLRGQLPVSIEPTAAQEAAAAMISSMQGLIQDAVNNIKRQHSKRYEQVQVRYPAYPDIVWYDLWLEVSDKWLEAADKLEREWGVRLQAVAAALVRVKMSSENTQAQVVDQ